MKLKVECHHFWAFWLKSSAKVEKIEDINETKSLFLKKNQWNWKTSSKLDKENMAHQHEKQNRGEHYRSSESFVMWWKTSYS